MRRFIIADISLRRSKKAEQLIGIHWNRSRRQKKRYPRDVENNTFGYLDFIHTADNVRKTNALQAFHIFPNWPLVTKNKI